MSSSERVDELRRAILLGEVERDDPGLRRALEAHPQLVAELEDFDRLARELGEGARLEREVVAEARELGPVAEEAAVAAQVARLARERMSAGAENGPAWALGRRLALLAAAAALIAVGFFLTTRDEGRPDRIDQFLSTTEVELLEPIGEAGRVGAFRWEAKLPASGWFEVTVFDLSAEDPFESPVSSGRVIVNTWSPSAAQSSKWKEIEWTLRVFDGTARELFSASASASFSGE